MNKGNKNLSASIVRDTNPPFGDWTGPEASQNLGTQIKSFNGDGLKCYLVASLDTGFILTVQDCVKVDLSCISDNLPLSTIYPNVSYVVY